MTEQTITTPADAPDSPQGPFTEPKTPDAPSEDKGSPSREAAKWRTQFREAETALAEAQSRLAVLQRAEIERLASACLSHPSDLFTLSGNELASYLTDAGTVDAEKVAADVAAILQERPGLKPLSPAYDRTQGMSGNPSRPTPTFGDLLKS